MGPKLDFVIYFSTLTDFQIRPGGSGETGEAEASPLLSKLHDLPLFPSEIQFISAFSLPTLTVVPPGLSVRERTRGEGVVNFPQF